MGDIYENNNLATVIGGSPAAGYIKIADNVFIQVKRKPFILHRFMMRMFFGWKWAKDWHTIRRSRR